MCLCVCAGAFVYSFFLERFQAKRHNIGPIQNAELRNGFVVCRFFFLLRLCISLLFTFAFAGIQSVYDIRTCASDDNRATEFMYEVIFVHCYSILRRMRTDRCERARKGGWERETERERAKSFQNAKTRKKDEYELRYELRVGNKSLFLFSDGFFFISICIQFTTNRNE